MSKTLYRLKPIIWNHRVLGREETYSARVGDMYVFITNVNGAFDVYYEYSSCEGLERKSTYGTLSVAKAQAEREIERHLTKHFERIMP